ncbi:hypothetical protein D3C87_2200770 [compost metagenome]
MRCSCVITGPNSLPALNWLSIDENRLPTGDVMPAWKRGFCRSRAASNVDPERGRPEMK